MRFLNTRIDNLTMEETLSQIEHLVDARTGGYVVTPNVDHIVQLEKNEKLREAYQKAALVLTDGQPLIWISKLLKCPIKEKISGSDLFPHLCERSAQKGWRVYLLGAAPGVARKAAENLRGRYPGLQIVGTSSPAYGFEKDEQQKQKIWSDIRRARPDILIMAFGTPKQELFLLESRKELEGILAFGLGASLDFMAGTAKRAPLWMQRCGLEWLYRLLREPRRLYRRYLIQDSKIVSIVWKYRKQPPEGDAGHRFFS